MTGHQRQRAEQERIARYILDSLAKDWDESVHFTMVDDTWLARKLDNYQASYSLSAVEEELIPLANHLRNLCNANSGPQFISMHDRVRKALHEFRR